MEIFDTMGRTLDARWRAEQRRPEALPALASAILVEARLPERADPLELAREALRAGRLPRQRDPQARFGNPPLTVYDGDGFYIDLLYWMDSTTCIHQHAFSGAFQLLRGESLHVTYEHRLTQRINPRLRLGELRCREAVLLKPGAVREIRSGEDFVHANFHLDRPTVTVVIRSDEDTEAPPQYNYLRSGLSWDPFAAQVSRGRALQLAEMLIGAEHPEAEAELLRLVTQPERPTPDLELSWWALNLARRALRPRARQEALFGRARGRLGLAAEPFAAALESARREDAILARRSALTEARHRFVLALLLNVPERADILRILGERWPGEEPEALLVRLLGEMSNERAPDGASALGVELDEGALTVFRALLAHPEEEEALQALSADFDVDTERDGILELCRSLRRSALFAPLFELSP